MATFTGGRVAASQQPAMPHLISFVTIVLVVMAALRLPYFGLPAGRDEAGFLLVGASWDHGPWLYGQYWVDRPPLLIWIMELAGNLTTLRLFGLLASALMVLGVCRAAFVIAGSRAAMWAAGAAALFSTAHWFGVARTNGEMLASPFVAWGIALAAQALLRPDRRSWWFGLFAGSLAAGAMLIKQTIVDGIVFAIVLAVVVAWQQPERRRQAAAVALAGITGFAIAMGVALAAAAARGTTPGELFDALVTFRADAGEVIRVSASSATTERLWALVGTWAVSGLSLIAVLTVWHAIRRRDPALIATGAVILFVSAAALMGGSYWAHYLIQLVPASALAAGLLATVVRPQIRWSVAGLAIASTVANLTVTLVSPPLDGSTAQQVGDWLRASAEPSDTAVVAYGQPNVLSNAKMSSPYPFLWSLPVRTLDPDLAVLSSTLDGSQRPTWFVDWSGIGSWGITDPTRLETVLHEHYREVATMCGRTVWLERTRPRHLAPVEDCP